MAAITLSTVHQAARVGGQVKTVLAVFREMLDAFVSSRMRGAAAEAEYARSLKTPRHVITIDERTMIAIQITGSDLSERQTPSRLTVAVEQDGERSDTLPPGEPASVHAQLPPLDPDVVSDGIPAFFIGRNKEGFWVARDVKGQIGGIFLLESSALSFARRNSWPAGCAIIFPSERFELDLENKGNPLVTHIGPLIHLAMRHRRRLGALIRKMTKTVKRRLEDLLVR